MFPRHDLLTLDALLSDPLTRLVMNADNITPLDVEQAFDKARAGLMQCQDARFGRAYAGLRRGSDGCVRWAGG